MAETLTRTFAITASPRQIIGVASTPLLAPAYLNFLTQIRAVEVPSPGGAGKLYDVWVHYRSLIKTQGRVEHHVDAPQQQVRLRHDGPIVMFDATFSVATHEVHLRCNYIAKVPLATWIISKVLDRALAQVATAMDRYAASFTVGPQ
jgi:hypothetical protein